jgi:hypothetical protein
MKKKEKTQISVLHLSEFNLPAIAEIANKDYISFGDDNLYPQYLLELYNGSSINNAIIKGVAAMIYGEGIDATDRDNSPEHKEQWLKLTSLLKGSQKDLLKCLAFDLKLFGMCYVNVIWNKPRTKIVEMYHVPAQYIRSGKTNSYGDVEVYYYSADWTNVRKFKPRVYKSFSSKDRTEASQVLCIKDYSPGSYYYSLPDYQGSTSYIQLDMEIAQFHLSNIKSGMFPSLAINMSNGIPSHEERRKIERQINDKFAGSGNAGRILLTFNDGKETAPEIVPITSNDNSDSYQFLSQETTRKVLTGHRIVSPLLFGVKGDGSGFGNNADELRDSYSLFNNTVIKPFQNTLLSGLEPVLQINDIHLDLYFKSLKPADFIDIETVAKVSEEEQEKEGIDTDEPIKKEFKALKDIDTKPTKGMIAEAKKGLEWRREYGRGGTETGVARARTISNGQNLSISTIKRMNSFFARHEKSSKGGEGFEPGEDGFPSAGRIAWALWGGDAGQSWAAKKVKEIKNVEELTELTEDDSKVFLSNLKGTEIDKDEWFELGEIDTEDTDSNTESKFEAFANQHLNKYYEFASASRIPSNPDSPNSDSNAGFIRVLYRYSQNISSKSRDFCKQMVRLSKGGKLYTINNLKQASNLTVNKGFGKKGAATYDIFKWKGGVYCHHYFVRKFFVRKRVPKGSEVTIGGKTYKAGAYLPNGSLDMFKNSFLSEVNSGRFASSWKKIKGQEPKGPAPTLAPINTPTRGKYS